MDRRGLVGTLVGTLGFSIVGAWLGAITYDVVKSIQFIRSKKEERDENAKTEV